MSMQPRPTSRGRPRSLEADRAILEAAFKLLCERGFAHMSIEAVAAEAGVGKTTIYRRYANKLELAIAAVRAHLNVEEVPRTGDTRADLALLLDQTIAAVFDGPVMSLVGSFVVEKRTNPELLDVFRRRLGEPRRALMREVLRHGIGRGEVRPDVDLEVAIDMVGGAVFYTYIWGSSSDENWAKKVLEIIFQGIGGDGAGAEE